MLQCLCKSEHIIAHNTFWNVLATIALKSETHMQREVSHLSLCHIWHQVDILIIINKFQTLTNIVIVDPTHLDMVHHALSITLHVLTTTIKKKTWSFVEHAQKNNFIPLAIEIYGHLHFHFNSFFNSCAHATIAHHQWSSLILLMFIFYY